jgi:hypothetical protein
MHGVQSFGKAGYSGFSHRKLLVLHLRGDLDFRHLYPLSFVWMLSVPPWIDTFRFCSPRNVAVCRFRTCDGPCSAGGSVGLTSLNAPSMVV